METLYRIPKKSGISSSATTSRPQHIKTEYGEPSRPHSSTLQGTSLASWSACSASTDPAFSFASSLGQPISPVDEEEDQVLQEILQDPDDDTEDESFHASTSTAVHKNGNNREKKPSKELREGGRDPDGVRRDYGKLRLGQKLADYDVIRMTASDLHALIHDGFIDLEPEYQRDVVWPEKKQIMLIDSMLNNFYIPAVIFSIRKEWSKEKGMELERRVCMDGKQRLTSMVRFMDGLIPYIHGNGIKYWYNLPNGETKRNQQLPDRLKREFDGKPISCIQYQDISEDDEREIFARVQLGVALSPAEKLQGMSSPFAAFVRQLQKQYIDADGTLGDAIKWQKKRGVDFACVAQIVFALYHLPNFTWPGLSKLEKFLKKKEVPTKTFKLEVLQIFSNYVALATDPRYYYGFQGIGDRVSPVEMVMIGLLLGYMKDYKSEDKAYHIKQLRLETRKQFKDIRMNDRVTKFMWSYIQSIKVPTKYVPSREETSSVSRKRKAARADENEFRPHKSRR